MPGASRSTNDSILSRSAVLTSIFRLRKSESLNLWMLSPLTSVSSMRFLGTTFPAKTGATAMSFCAAVSASAVTRQMVSMMIRFISVYLFMDLECQ